MATTDIIDIHADAFAPADLVGDTGAAENATELIATVLTTYPEKLKTAQILTENPELTATLKEADFVAIADALGCERQTLRLKVRGGVDAQPETVTYVYVDDRGPWKGCFPLSAVKALRHDGELKADPKPDHLDGELVGHVSQKDQIAATRLAKDQEAIKERQREAEAQAVAERFADIEAKLEGLPSPAELQAERDRANDLERQLAEERDKQPPRETPPNGLEDYFEKSAKDVVAGLKVTDRRTALEILGLEQRNDKRKTVIDAANERLGVLAEQDAETQRELDDLRRKLAEQTTGDEPAPETT